MSKSTKKAADQAEREKVHKRYSNRREPDIIYPARKQVDFYDADVHQRVAVYVRVSTDNLGQETSYELQKNYYEEFVLKHPNWSLVKIYADKGISGTSTKHRVALNQMLTDSRAGKIDLIITKSVSRLARNTVDCITMVRNLAELRNPVGVFFESECIFSLNEDTSMPLSFLASIAENESRIRSRSMEVSLAQRLNGGLPLTPKLLGYSHDTDGKLVINPDEAPTVKLIEIAFAQFRCPLCRLFLVWRNTKQHQFRIIVAQNVNEFGGVKPHAVVAGHGKMRHSLLPQHHDLLGQLHLHIVTLHGFFIKSPCKPHRAVSEDRAAFRSAHLVSPRM